jgi:ATP-dependent RNA helicase DeaD
MTFFSELGVREDIQNSLTSLGYITPTPIQEQAIPLALAGNRDLVALAQTGTGKTAAFGIPLVQMTDPECNRVQALVLCPTRELCVQVAGDMAGYAKETRHLNITPVYGGANIQTQINALRRGTHIVVATPGRLNDMIRRNKVDLSGIRSLVLDEADEMLQMGFKEELDAILAKTPSTKNVFLFSATMPSELARIAGSYLKDPSDITVGRRNAGAENIRHICYLVQAKHRYATLKRIADYYPDMYAIIFCRTRLETKEVAERLTRDGYNADALHGDLSQSQRDWVMGRFRRRNLQLLVATDVAARGLDVDDLTHVINFTLPDEGAAYTHRSGRTGRAGKAGISIAIINMREKYKVREIEKKLGKTFEKGRVPTGEEIYKQQVFRQLDTIARVDVGHEQFESLMPEMLRRFESMDREELIKRFVSVELNRFIDYYKSAPDLNVSDKKKPKEESKPLKANGKKKSIPGKTRPSRFTRFFINVGKKDGVNAGRLIGRINEASGRADIKIGKIQIMNTSSLLEADGRFSREVLDAFSYLMINGKPVSAEIAGDQKEKKNPAGSRKNRRASIRRRSFAR